MKRLIDSIPSSASCTPQQQDDHLFHDGDILLTCFGLLTSSPA
jgi:hypothetical protein